MQPHHWAQVVSKTFRRENQLDADDPLVGEPSLISDALLVDEGADETGEAELAQLGLQLYTPTFEQVRSGEFGALAVHVTMLDDPRASGQL